MRSFTFISLLTATATLVSAAPLVVRQDAATTTSCGKTYNVVTGDVCWDIVRRLNEASSDAIYTLMSLYALNPAINADCTNLQIGQALCVSNDVAAPADAAAPAVAAAASSSLSEAAAPSEAAAASPEVVSSPATDASVANVAVAPASADTSAPASSSSETYRGELTYYYQNNVAGNCGQVRPDTDLIAALHPSMYGNGENCGKYIRITAADGTSIVVQVADSCPSCVSEQSLDVSSSAFVKLASLDTGMISMSWVWV